MNLLEITAVILRLSLAERRELAALLLSLEQPLTTALEYPRKRQLGFHPVAMTEDLLEPTDQEVVSWFYKA